MEKMDFIKQFRAFIKLSAGRLDMKEQAVYVRLLGIWNELRRPEWFPVSISQLQRETKAGSNHTIIEVKRTLERKGFIRTRNGNKTGTTSFKIVSLACAVNAQEEVTCADSAQALVQSVHKTCADSAQALMQSVHKTCADSAQALMHVVHTSQRDKDTKNTEIAAAASDTDLSEVVQTFSNNIHPITGEIELGKLTSFLDDFGKKWTLAAIAEAAENNGRSVRYIGAILERWKRDGFKAGRRGEHGRAGKHPAGAAGHSGESEKVRRRAEELAKFRAEYNAKIERERKAREAARSAENH